LGDAAQERFAALHGALTQPDIPFFQEVRIEPSLVRGLDYYTDTVFEFVANTGELGAQNTVLAGGRYDGLVEQMGGAPTPAIGFAAGVERLLLLMPQETWVNIPDTKIMFLPSEDAPKGQVHSIATMIRNIIAAFSRKNKVKGHCSVEILWQGSHKKRMERADKRGATHVITLSKEDIERRVYNLKNMRTGTVQQVNSSDIANPEKLIEIFNITELDPGLRRDDKA